MILPYMDYNDLYKQINHDLPISDNTVSSAGISNSAARAQTVREMLCPSDSFNSKPFNGSAGARVHKRICTRIGAGVTTAPMAAWGSGVFYGRH